MEKTVGGGKVNQSARCGCGVIENIVMMPKKFKRNQELRGNA